MTTQNRMLSDLMTEPAIRVLQAGILRWRVRVHRLELQVDRLEHELAAAVEERDRLQQEVRMAAAGREADGRIITRLSKERDRLRTLADQRLDECRRLVDDKKRLTAANIELRQEVTQARDEAGRLRQAAEHAAGFLDWGMDADSK